MPMSGALLLSNPRYNRASRRSRRKVSIASLLRKKNGSHGYRARDAHGCFVKRRNLHKGTTGGTYRFNKKRHNGLALMNRRRNGLALMNRRRNGLAFSGLAVRTNGMLGSISGLVARIPFIGSPIAAAIAPAVAGAVAIVGVHYLLQYGAPFLAEIPYVGAYISYIEPVTFTVGGIVFGVAIIKLPIPFVSPATRKMLATAAIVGGAAVDALRYMTTEPEPAAVGDGGFWQVR